MNTALSVGASCVPPKKMSPCTASYDRVILTFDLDFGDIRALGVRDDPSVVILCLADERSEVVNARLATLLKERSEDLETGALILVEDTRYRVRKLPIGVGHGTRSLEPGPLVRVVHRDTEPTYPVRAAGWRAGLRSATRRLKAFPT